MLDETADRPNDDRGDSPEPIEAEPADLVPIIYEELRHLAHHHMSREPVGHTLQTTAIVHEAYLRLVKQNKKVWHDRTHFYAIASQMVRRVLVDHARAKQSQKRGGGARPVALQGLASEAPQHAIDLLALDEALHDLAQLDERQCRVVELRYFGGLSIDETAKALDVSPGTVKGAWRVAKVWLRRRLESDSVS